MTASTPTHTPHTLSDFDYALPPELIAQHPAPQRSAARLLDGTVTPAVDRIFRELPALLQPGDLLVFNDTRVINARLFGRKASGGAVQALVERVLPVTAAQPHHEVLAHLRASKSPRAGSLLHFGGERSDRGPSGPGFSAEVLGRAGPDQGLFRLRFPSEPLALLALHGHVPLPPYIDHADSDADLERYQTVFASRPGAVAAPTASLHFDAAVLAALAERGVASTRVTLHVGAGTFQPVRNENLDLHPMHSEWFEVSEAAVAAIEAARARGGRIVAAGTTTLRALESAAIVGQHSGQHSGQRRGQLTAGANETELFIRPGFEFQVVDMLVTNFHLPMSTLLMLVSAFAGHDKLLSLYRHAIAQRYRFFSYGDAMLLRCEASERPMRTAPS